LGTNKKVIIVHPQTRYWSPVERTLKLFFNFFSLKKRFKPKKPDVHLYQFPFVCSLREIWEVTDVTEEDFETITCVNDKCK
jgi:hypothetical protein